MVTAVLVAGCAQGSPSKAQDGPVGPATASRGTAAAAVSTPSSTWPRPADEGVDIGWSQCPTPQGLGYPIPHDAGFLLIAVDHDAPFTTNPCLKAQVWYAAAQHLPVQPVLFAAYPTAKQLATFGARGPYPAGTQQGRRRNTGWAMAQHAAANIKDVGMAPSIVWIYTESTIWDGGARDNPWQRGPTAAQANADVLTGIVAGLQAAKLAPGVQYLEMFPLTFGDLQLVHLPVWASVGIHGRERALLACQQDSLTGGPVHLIQHWTDEPASHDIACQGQPVT